MKRLLPLFILLAVIGGSALLVQRGTSQTSEYNTITIQGTADLLVDSTLTTAAMNNKRIYINGIYAFYDNGANTNPIYVDVVSGQTAFVTAARRVVHYGEAMTSSGVKGINIPVNVTSPADSTIYIIVNAASSDSLLLSVNYRFVGK